MAPVISGAGRTAGRRWRASAFAPVVASPALRRLLPAFAVSAIGDGMSAVGVAWLAIRIAAPADRSVLVGVAVAAYSLPAAAGAVLLARPLRALRARHLVAADATLRAAALGMIPLLYAFGSLSAAWYVALLAVSSLMHAWGLSGQYTLVAENLPPQARTAGNALLSSFTMASYIIGPLLAGLALATAGPALPIAADAASFAVLAIAAATATGQPGATVPINTAPANAVPTNTEPGNSDKPDRMRGFAVIGRSRPLAGLLALTVAYYFLYGPVEVALPLYVTGPLHGGGGLLALFWAVFGIGATAGSIATALVRRLPVWPVLLVAVVGWGAAMAPLGLLRLPGPALVSFAVGGLLYAPYPALSTTLFQRHSPPELLSQVLAARGALTTLATPLGTALGGPLAAWLGAQQTLLASAAATIACGLVATAVLAARRPKPLDSRSQDPG